MAMGMKSVIGLVLSLIIVGMLVPTGILYLYVGQFTNICIRGYWYQFADVLDPVIVTLFCTILPIVIMIGIMIKFIPKK